MKISFLASLKQSSPASKPLKFGAEGDSEIILEADASQKEEIKKLIGQYGIVFQVTLIANNNNKIDNGIELEPYAI